MLCIIDTLQLSDSVYWLHHPEDAKEDILFFHGFTLETGDEPHLTTWKNKDGELWPQTWLPKHIPGSHVLSISYDSSVEKTDKEGRMDLYVMAERLLENLLLSDVDVGQSRPVVLVGRCVGGLVIKELCLRGCFKILSFRLNPDAMNEADADKVYKFLLNIRGIFYYGTPHKGFEQHVFEHLFKSLKGSLLHCVKTLVAETARLDQNFRSLCRAFHHWKLKAVGESQMTCLKGRESCLFLPEASARCDAHEHIALKADHFTLCKPETETSDNYLHLKHFAEKSIKQYRKFSVQKYFSLIWARKSSRTSGKIARLEKPEDWVAK
ncbi:hypothetical protein Mapa_006943 [Marchantia paleacea]|nr:hypothetical protein Mapa_006943 [Marchantia paleacea]